MWAMGKVWEEVWALGSVQAMVVLAKVEAEVVGAFLVLVWTLPF